MTHCIVVSFSGLNTFTCVVADTLLSQGFTQFVTSSCAWVCSELLVRLCSCRISRLVYISFAWRTHFGHPVPSFWTLVLHSVFMGLIGPIGPTGLMGVLDFFLVRFVRCVCFCQPFWTPCRHGLPGQTACPAFPDFSAFSIFRLVQRLRD